ncbi:hypothetical protein KPH14_004137 [Odynerus spinipes]|uniref:Uncharacterized protein n=1 Tax=Odynerus spinipes TaxID=1348599 RepID=A0AAD9RY25_9HYME|nr:hypothetical protein KPH14_004137 [Odynerus spinipes]
MARIRLSGAWLLFVLLALGRCESDEDGDMSQAFIEVAKSFLADRGAMGDLRNAANAFVQSDTGKQLGDVLSGGGKSSDNGIGQMLLKVGGMLAAGNDGRDDMWGSLLEGLSSVGESSNKRTTRDVDDARDQGFNFESMLNMGSMMLGQQTNGEALLGFLPMILDTFNYGGGSPDSSKKHDHSGHSWFLPPILENLHVMWEHFSNSELGQALWKKSGLSNIVGQMSDERGNLQYEKILDSFENPTLRRRWIKSLTNYVAEWIAHISDPTTRQRYLTTVQFIGNSFLKSQGYPKMVMFDANKPTESITRLLNAVARKHLGMKIDSSQYVKPAISYIQELLDLASEKGFIMSRISARELSNRLSDTINNDIMWPSLKSYRAYKWSVKHPECASQILCTLNEKNDGNEEVPMLRNVMGKITSFPAAWAVSNKININFWVLYGAIMEHGGCTVKFPADYSTIPFVLDSMSLVSKRHALKKIKTFVVCQSDSYILLTIRKPVYSCSESRTPVRNSTGDIR